MAAGGEPPTAVSGAVTPEPETAGLKNAPAGPAASGSTGRRPWWVWAVPFTFLFVLLCVRNRFLFTTRLYEQGDAGANSILIEQAKHFTLLIGNYSREGFNHPGPAYMYVQAFGEYLFSGQACWFCTPQAPPNAPVILRFSGVAVAPVLSS